MLDVGDPCTLLKMALQPPNINDIRKTILLLKEVQYLSSNFFYFSSVSFLFHEKAFLIFLATLLHHLNNNCQTYILASDEMFHGLLKTFLFLKLIFFASKFNRKMDCFSVDYFYFLSSFLYIVVDLFQIGALTIKQHGRINPLDGDLTYVGKVLGSLPTDVRIGKLLILSHVFGCLDECLIIGINI